MKMPFTKMHGAGNDYVYVNGFTTQINNPEKVAIQISDRHFGIGGDGLVIILPSDVADFKMRMFNLDGSEGRMCGNAIRCIGKYVYDNGLTQKSSIAVETLSGIKYLDLVIENGVATGAAVDMGKAILSPKDIPMVSDLPQFVNQDVEVDGKNWKVTAVSMGNPHAVTFVDSVDALDLEKIGPKFEHHPLFPQRVNTEFVESVNENTVKMRVWERGSGETLACGTGACATVVACVLMGMFKQDQEVNVVLRGGTLRITYQSSGHVRMCGPAATVFTGEMEVED